MATNGLEAGAFEQAGTLATDPSFLESPAHARGVNVILSGWQFPTSQQTAGLNYTFISQNTKDINGNHPTIYQDGTYTAIPFYYGLQNIGGANWVNLPSLDKTPSYSAGTGSATVAEQLIFNLPAGWTVLTWAAYYGTPPSPYFYSAAGDPPGVTSTATPPAMVAVAPWGSNACTMRTVVSMTTGVYTGVWGFPSGYNFVNDHPVNPTPVNMTNAISGFCRFKIISADFTQTIDVTPILTGFTSPMGIITFSMDSVALLGNRLPFFPSIEISALPDPGIAQSKGNTTATATYGGLWTSN